MQSRGKMSGGDAVNAVTSGNLLSMPVWKVRYAPFVRREVLAGYNDLATTDSQLLSEWDYEQNKLKPTKVSWTSAKRAWWKCRHGHSWSMKINERTILNKGCRICEQEYLSLFPALAVSYYSNRKDLKAELGSDQLHGVPLETYIPSEKLAIEPWSADENIEIMKAYMCKQRGIRLISCRWKAQNWIMLIA